MFRTRPGRSLILIVLSGLLYTLLLIPVSSPLQAENNASGALLILQKGPYRETGLPFFPRDLTPYFKAEYSLREDKFEVYFLEDDLDELKSWDLADCTVKAGELSVDGSRYYYRPFGNGGCLIYRAEAGFDLCSLIPAFERRFNYFMGTTPEWLLPPFPAIVEL